MFGWFRKRFKTPIEERNYGVLYATLSLLLFIGTLWAVQNEVAGRRPWKDYQEQFKNLKVRVLNKMGRDASSKYNKDQFRAIRDTIRTLNHELHEGEAATALHRIDKINEEIRDVSQARANLKSKADNRNYLYEHSKREGHLDDAAGYHKERTDLEAQMAELDTKIAGLEAERAKLRAEKVGPLLDRKKELEGKRDSIFGPIADIKKKLDETRGMPIKIRQVMLPAFEKTNFGPLQMRADRCQSCHLGIGDPVFADTTIFTKVGKGEVFRDKEMAAKYRKVYGPHPQSELLKTHNIERFGCTPCHGGQAMSVDDVEHAHGMEAHWERPLLKGKFVEGACRKCHEGTYDFGTMEKVSEGRKLFVDFGCFGCHEGPMAPDFKEYKVGPSLHNVSKKVTPAWAFNWIRNPQKWNEHTRMPNFKFSAEETEQVVAFLWSQSKESSYAPVSSSVPSGDPARGLQTMREVGCIACHTVDKYEARGKYKFVASDTSTHAVASSDHGKGGGGDQSTTFWPNAQRTGNRVAEGNNFGPDLNKIGSKVTNAWIYDWVRNPKHYNPKSRMPSLRLTDGEAADVTAYLASRRDPSPEATPTLSHLNDAAWVKKGEKLVRDYGCFGCHQINGMEDEGKVSVPLTDFGSKTASDLYFGFRGELELKGVREHFRKAGFPLGEIYSHLHNGEDWFVWTVLKLKNPRIFASDVILQKMPVFNMTDEEAYAMTIALRSYTKAYVPPQFTAALGAQRQAMVDDGRFLVHWNNCVGCHRVEGNGGLVLDILREETGKKGDDINPYGPPNLNTVGAKIQEPWFYGFVSNPASRPVRTWLKIRMPSYNFSPQVISRLSKYFLGLEDESLGFTDYSFHPATQSSYDAGRLMWEKLKCAQCHAAGSAPAVGGETAVPAPNLALAGDRIKPDWIVRWLRDPQRVAPGTKMPNFFGTWDEPVAADPNILGGDAKAQMEALRDYVWRIGGPKSMSNEAASAGVQASVTTPAPAAVAPAAAQSDTAKSASRATNGASKKLSMR
jgi:cytochrome c1